MPTYDWTEFLTRWSSDLLASEDALWWDLPQDVFDTRWMGFPGASEEQIAASEARLGTQLPPSYREFLKVSNGWRNVGEFIHNLWPVDKIEWFRVRHQKDWIEPWQTGSSMASSMYGAPEPIPDEVYLDYSDDQSPDIREEYLHTALEISDVGDSAIFILNPQILTPDGEWEAWFFASWQPGARRYRSFWDMMQGEYQGFLNLDESHTSAGRKRRRQYDLAALIQAINATVSSYKQVSFTGSAEQKALKIWLTSHKAVLENAITQLSQINAKKDDPQRTTSELQEFMQTLEEAAGPAEDRKQGKRHTGNVTLNTDDAAASGIKDGQRMVVGAIRWYLSIHAANRRGTD